MTTKTKRMTAKRFHEIYDVTPVRARSNTSGIVWAIPAKRAGMGYAPHYMLHDYRAAEWAPTLAGLADIVNRKGY